MAQNPDTYSPKTYSPKKYSIGIVADIAHCQVQTIRYYESIGIMPEPERSAGGRRLYTNDHIDRLQFVRHARDMGFSLEQIKTLLNACEQSTDDCGEIDIVVREHLHNIEQRIHDLENLRKNLKEMLNHEHGSVADCKAVETLYNHEKCAHKH